ncbi:MAG TPA: lipid-binding SYLF domain-containing protein [Acetobacteraceae bacterium]|nr:lipid-binding SYLF domain-containing protein [Acetobacteraceae bacterium]
MNRFERPVRALAWTGLLAAALALAAGSAFADSYSDTVALFKQAGASAGFFRSSYGYAVFPTIGKGGFVVGGAHGKGRVYKEGRLVGDTTMNQVSVGFQAGGQAYSEIIFFQTRLDLARFESGKFALGAQASAVAITASASASTSTAGSSAGASGTQQNATTAGQYQDGMAVFTIAKGGLMYEAAVAGQKFSYEPRD